MLVFVGSINADTIAVVPHLPGADERLIASTVVDGSGGNAATAAVAAARSGAECAFVGPIAADALGARLLDELCTEGIDVSGVVPVPAGTGGASVILVDEATGARSICVHPAAPFRPTPRAVELIRSADWVHADQLGAGVAATAGPRRLSVDAGNPIPGFDPRDVDLFGPTAAVLRRSYGDLPAEALIAAALQDGARTVVATDGSHGAVGGTLEGPVTSVPALDDVEVRSTLGAGDVFHGALLVAVARDWDLPTAMRYASVAAGLSCRAVDARSGIPSEAEIRHYCEARGIDLP